MLGTIFSIEEFSVYDGPGIRTSVFLKGCPLRCTWCHNPEGQSPQIQIVRSPNGCIGCNECIKTSVLENGNPVFTQEGINRCPKHLLRVCGEEIESDELCERLLKNENFLRNGGVTFSGGEPLMQSEFLFECLSNLDGRLHSAIQTCGFCDAGTFEKALSLADYFLYDIKLVDNALHEKYTGVSNDLILKNFSRLTESGVDFSVRLPLIPSVTDTEQNITQTATLLLEHGVDAIELLPYNKMAGGKYKMLLREYEPDFDDTAEPSVRSEIFARFGINAKVL